MTKNGDEWIRQADYDYETAQLMRRSGRNFYAVFLCHISVEKGLKALFLERTASPPPKTHNLLWLLAQIGIKPPESIGELIVRLNEANVATRYPEKLSEMIKIYHDKITDSILNQTGDILAWIKSMR